MLENIIDFIKRNNEWLIIIIPTIILIVLIIGGIKLDEYQCQKKAYIQELECHWSFIEGCMVKKDGKWIDYDRYRIID